MSFQPALRVAVVGFVLSVFAVLGVSAPASAHDAPVTFTPAEGSTVTAAPTQVTIDFSADVDPNGAEGVVLSADKVQWQSGAATVEGATLTIPLKPDMPNGAYEVQWRAVSEDGHAQSKSYTFTLDAPQADPTPVVVTPDATEEPVATPVATPDASETSAEHAGHDMNNDASSPLPWVVGGIVVLLVVGLISIFVARSRRNS